MPIDRSMVQGLALVAVVVLSGGQQLEAQEDRSYVLATGRTTGKSYSVGVGISSLAKVKLLPTERIDVTAVESKGFVHNIRLMQEDKAQFAILQAMFGHFERTGTGTFMGEEPRDDIRAVAQLWRDADHFVMNKDYIQTGTIEDLANLKGMPVAMGWQGPGPIESNRLIMSHLGIDIDQTFDLAYLNYGDSAAALREGRIMAMSTPIRPPARHIAATLDASGDQVQLLEFTDEQLAQADGGLGLWTRYTIPAGTYPGQDQDVQTVAKSNLLVVRADVDDDVVYQVTKTIFENLEFLRNIHEATYETSIDRALTGLTVPLHPGALRYYQEIGVLAPDATQEAALSNSLRAGPAAFGPTGALKRGVELEPAVVEAEVALESVPQPEADAPEQHAALDRSTGSAELVPNGKKFVVYFGLNQTDVGDEAARRMADAVGHAEQNGVDKIVVAGHSDRAGNPEYNIYLARVRAEAVAAQLRDSGVADERISVTQFGETLPAVDTGDGIHESLNRRVEITFIPGDPGRAAAPTVGAIEPPSDAEVEAQPEADAGIAETPKKKDDMTEMRKRVPM